MRTSIGFTLLIALALAASPLAAQQLAMWGAIVKRANLRPQ